MTIVCSECRELNADDALMCGMCGTPLKKMQQPPAQSPQSAPTPRPAMPSGMVPPSPPPPPVRQTPRFSRQAVQLEYVGFLPRFGALIIDTIVGIFVVFMGIFTTAVLLGTALLHNLVPGSLHVVTTTALISAFIIILSFPALYSILMICSPLQGTVGKLAVGIKVADASGNRISYGAGIVRFLIFSGIPYALVYFGNALGLQGVTRIFSVIFAIVIFVGVASGPYHQGLHDSIAGTYVVRK